MQKIIILQGAPGSGKTTWAQNKLITEPNMVILSRDDIRFANYGIYFGDPIDEDFVTNVHGLE